jgi:hypothetical protein
MIDLKIEIKSVLKSQGKVDDRVAARRVGLRLA